MDVAILVSFALRMANHNDHLLSVSHPLLNTALASHLLVVCPSCRMTVQYHKIIQKARVKAASLLYILVVLIVRMGRECLLPLSHDVP